MLNSLCSDIVGSQLVMQIKKNKKRVVSPSPSKGANKFMKSQESPKLSQDEKAFTKFKASVKDSGLIEEQDPNIEKKAPAGKLTEHFVESSPKKGKTGSNKRNSDMATAANTNAKKRKIEEISGGGVKPVTLHQFFSAKKDQPAVEKQPAKEEESGPRQLRKRKTN